MPSLDHRIPPPIVGAIVALAMWFVASVGPSVGIDAPMRYFVVALLVVAGVAFDVMGMLAFRASRTTLNPLHPGRATALVTGGVYRVTRNPMYVGMGLLLLAWAVYLDAWPPFVGPMVFVLYITRFQIQPEEQVLRQRFGERYALYAARVRRWL